MTQAQALSILKTGANVFLTGEPGSGKTHTINQYVSWLREHDIEPAITASTGIAATHIGGMTIHSWSGIGVKKRLTNYDLDQIAQNKRIYERMRETKILIIDEVSMLSGTMLSMVEAVCRVVRRVEKPFGGLQVILVGDFFQLPPVQKRDEQEEQESLSLDTTDGQFAFESSAWQSMKPLICYLSEQHRQEDGAFLEFLSAIRHGTVGEMHKELLRTRYSPVPRGGITQLYSHNADVDSINNAQLEKLEREVWRASMQSRGPEKLVETLKRGCLSPEVLSLKIGARVMFTKNDLQGQKFVNGTLGTVTDFVKESGLPVVKKNTGGTMIVEPMDWNLTDGGTVLARITQVPLRLAWAMTVHKSQGMSLDAAHMDLSHTFEYGQGYVALSRVRTLAGLSIAGLNDKALMVHPRILAKDIAFREASDVAGDAFAKLSDAELEKMHANFVLACGGKKRDTAHAPIEKKSKLEAIREKHQNAYRSWDKAQDDELTRRYEDGERPSAIAKAFGRKPGAIRARLEKLGLIEL